MKKPTVFITILIFNVSLIFAQTEKPNFVFILVDDLGYSDVDYMHQKPDVNTPYIDKLSKNGMMFTNAYAACPLCSPTRASILTGKYPASLNLTCHIPGIGMEKYVALRNKGQKLMEAKFIDHLPLKEVTFAEVLKEDGYKTAFFGKWHLGGAGSQHTDNGIVNERYDPDHQGFDINIGGCAYGQPVSYFSPYKNGTINDGPTNEYLTDRLGDEACKFIESNSKEPFLAYLSFYSVHRPHQAPDNLTKRYNGDKYLAMIEKVDENIGKVLKILEEHKLIKNTLVVFYSDNGGVRKNPPLRDIKGSLYEGGIRVPLIFSYPGFIPKKTICDVPVTSPDFFPTILDATGAKTKKYSYVQPDGISLWPFLEYEKELSDRAIFWHFPHHRRNDKSMASAVREGDWKLIWEFETDSLSLFNLKSDIHENKNLADKYPVKRDDLFAKLKTWLKETNASMPKPNPNYNN